MELLCPTCFCILNCEDVHHGRLELKDFLLCEFLATIYLIEDCRDLSICIVFSIELLDSVVGEFTTHRLEEIMTVLKSIDKVGKRTDVHSAYL